MIYFLGDWNKHHVTMTSQSFWLSIELLPLRTFSLEMLYATYTLGACLLLCEVHKNPLGEFQDIFEFLQKGYKLRMN